MTTTGVKVEGLNYFADTLLFGGVILSLAVPARPSHRLELRLPGYRSLPIEPEIAGACRTSGRGLAVLRRTWRLVADNHNGELRDKCGDCADGGEQWSQDNANGGDGHGNLHKRVAVLILHNDALDVAFVDQVANLIDQVAAQHLNLFNEIIEAHIVDTLIARGSSQNGWQF